MAALVNDPTLLVMNAHDDLDVVLAHLLGCLGRWRLTGHLGVRQLELDEVASSASLSGLGFIALEAEDFQTAKMAFSDAVEEGDIEGCTGRRVKRPGMAVRPRRRESGAGLPCETGAGASRPRRRRALPSPACRARPGR